MLSYEETVMLKYINGLPYGQVISNYMFERFGNRINEIGEEFLNDGYLTLTSAEENAEKALVPELKAILKSHGLKASGNKKELVERVKTSFSHEDLEQFFPDSRYLLTELGEKEIENKKIYFDNERLYLDFTNSEIKAALNKYSQADSLSILLSMVKERGQYYYKSDKISSLSSSFFHAYRIYFEKCDYINALFSCFAEQYISMSGLYDDNIVNSFFLNHEHELQSINNIDKCLSALNYSTDDFKRLSLTEFIPILPKLAFSYYNPETVVEMVCDRLNGIYKSTKDYPNNTPSENNPNYNFINYN